MTGHAFPESWVADGLALAETCTLFGQKFADMTRDELIAAAAHGWDAERKVREREHKASAERAAFFVERARFFSGDRTS